MPFDNGPSCPPPASGNPGAASPPAPPSRSDPRSLSDVAHLLKTSPEGFLLALEGLDGSGKSTQARLVAEALERAGLPVSSFREPTTDGEWGRILRASGSSGRRPPREELELFLKDRAWDLEARVLPALRAGRVAVLDRYVLSSVSYQGALGIPPTEILEANAGFPWPDLTVVLDLEPAEGLRRIREGRGAAADAFEDAQYLAGVREILGLAAALPGVEFMDAKEAVGMTASRIAERVQEAARDKGTRQALRG